MNKRNLFTGLGILLSFLIAGGGWVLTSTLIDKESDALLSATVITPLGVSPATPTGQTSTATTNGDSTDLLKERPILSETEINRILKYWTSIDEERLHEPLAGQLNMEQAIEAGTTGLLSLLADAGVLPIGLLETDFEKPRAYLAQRQLNNGDAPETLDPAYSYWTVILTNEDMNAALTINAVTGQIWKADIKIYSTSIGFDTVDAQIVLKAYLAYLGMRSSEATGSSYSDDHTFANMVLSDARLSYEVYMGAIRTGERIVLSHITLVLNSW